MPLVEGIPGCLRVTGLAESFYVLNDGGGLFLIDAGCLGALCRLKKELKAVGWESLPIRGVLATHGHIDHIWNIGRLARATGAWIAGSRLDAARFAGQPQVTGIGGPLARVERQAFRLPPFEAFIPDRWLQDGEVLEIWGGLTAVHLPGHTAGHTGFLSERYQVLFCADLFASYGRLSHFPPAVFNEDRGQMLASTVKALRLGCAGILPHHADSAAPAVHLHRLQRLAGRHLAAI